MATPPPPRTPLSPGPAAWGAAAAGGAAGGAGALGGGGGGGGGGSEGCSPCPSPAPSSPTKSGSTAHRRSSAHARAARGHVRQSSVDLKRKYLGKSDSARLALVEHYYGRLLAADDHTQEPLAEVLTEQHASGYR